MNWLNKRLFRKMAAHEPASEGGGVLFGLDPPEGCQFDVFCHNGLSWHVRIVRGGESLAHACELLSCAPVAKDAILRAARAALERYAVQAEATELQGLYPPKRTP